MARKKVKKIKTKKLKPKVKLKVTKPKRKSYPKEEIREVEYKGLTKKGIPRKRKPKEPRIYFTQNTENAIIKYLITEDINERNRIYNQDIRYSFYKLAENIIHTFKFYYTDSDTIEELKHEVVTFLLEKLHLYKAEKGKAFSYFGTIAKRYLIVYNENNYKKLQETVDVDEIDENELNMYEVIDNDSNPYAADSFINQYINYIDTNLSQLFPKPHDAKTADAIVELFRKRETLEIFNKKALYIYIREMVDISTPQITKIIKKLDMLRLKLYNEYYKHGHIKI
jgi:hypothetical protein